MAPVTRESTPGPGPSRPPAFCGCPDAHRPSRTNRRKDRRPSPSPVVEPVQPQPLRRIGSATSAYSSKSYRLELAAGIFDGMRQFERAHYGTEPDQFGEVWYSTSESTPLPVVVLLHGGYWQSQYGLDLMHRRQ